jgi:hypothetical protein
MFHCKKNDRRKETLKKTKGAIKKWTIHRQWQNEKKRNFKENQRGNQEMDNPQTMAK